MRIRNFTGQDVWFALRDETSAFKVHYLKCADEMNAQGAIESLQEKSALLRVFSANEVEDINITWEEKSSHVRIPPPVGGTIYLVSASDAKKLMREDCVCAAQEEQDNGVFKVITAVRRSTGF